MTSRDDDRPEVIDPAETSVQRREPEPLGVAATRFLANNPNVAIALGVGFAAAGVALKALQNSNQSNQRSY